MNMKACDVYVCIFCEYFLFVFLEFDQVFLVTWWTYDIFWISW